MTSKRARTGFNSDEIAKLEEAWCGGMTSLREKEKVETMSATLDRPAQQIKDWIGNKRQKQKKAGTEPTAVKHRPSAYDIRPSAYNMYCRGKTLEPSSSSTSFTNWSTEWNALSEDEKRTYKIKAQDYGKDLDNVPNTPKLRAHYLKLVSLHCDKLGKLGVHIGGFFVDQEDKLPGSFGSDRAFGYFAKTSKDDFLSQMIGQQCTSSENRIHHSKAVQKVRKIFNRCWERETGQPQLPYKAINNGMLTIDVVNLPDGVTFRDPSNMGTSQLKRIIACEDSLAFRVISRQSGIALPENAESASAVPVPPPTPSAPMDLCDSAAAVPPPTPSAPMDSCDSASAVPPPTPSAPMDSCDSAAAVPVPPPTPSAPMDSCESASAVPVPPPTPSAPMDSCDDIAILADLVNRHEEKVEESVEPSAKLYDVERIIKVRKRGATRQVLVKWKGYKKPTWEPEENL